MKLNIINEKSLTLLCGIGGVLHYLSYHLEEITLRDEWMMWLSMAIPTILGGIYLIMKMRLLRDKTYRKIKGARLQLYKTLVCVIMVLASTLMFGAYLNFFVLGANYLVTSGEKIETFSILEITSKRPGLRRRTRERVPLIRFSDGQLVDEVEIGGVPFEEFNKDISRIEITLTKGLLGLGIIKNIEVR